MQKRLKLDAMRWRRCLCVRGLDEMSRRSCAAAAAAAAEKVDEMQSELGSFLTVEGLSALCL